MTTKPVIPDTAEMDTRDDDVEEAEEEKNLDNPWHLSIEKEFKQYQAISRNLCASVWRVKG